MKTRDQAIAGIRAKFTPMIEAQRGVVLAQQNKLTDLEEQQKQALVRVEEFFDATSAKPIIDAVVANPPDEAKDN